MTHMFPARRAHATAQPGNTRFAHRSRLRQGRRRRIDNALFNVLAHIQVIAGHF